LQENAVTKSKITPRLRIDLEEIAEVFILIEFNSLTDNQPPSLIPIR
jgi:hypothetical protein